MKTVYHEVPVLVIGGGPVGMLTATQLAEHGIHCMLIERNLETTRWPKMDITNCRSMELLSRLGLADELRKQGENSRRLEYNFVTTAKTRQTGVPQNYSFDVIFSSGLGDKGEKLAKWVCASLLI